MMEFYLIERSMFALGNVILCIVALVIIVCRLNSMTRQTRFVVKLAHAAGVGAMVYSATSFSLNDWPSGARIGLMVYILCELWASRYAWRSPRGDEPPPSATIPGPLEPHR